MAAPLLFTRQMLSRLFGDKEPRDLRAMESAFRTVVSNDDAISTAVEGDNQTANGTQQQKSDYIDFDQNAPVLEQPGRIHWNSVDNTLNVGHPGGVVQQVGQEIYVNGFNATGSLISNGSTVSYSGAVTEGIIDIKLFLADGVQDAHQFLGVATQDILPGESGFITTLGLVRDIDTLQDESFEFWSVGTELYASPDVAGALTSVKPTSPEAIINVAYVVKVDKTQGVILVNPIYVKEKLYGQFTKLDAQSPSLANINQTLLYTNTEISNGVTLVSGSRFTVADSGLYSFSFNVQIQSSSASAKNMHFWFAKNGVNVPNSSFYVTVTGNGNYIDVSQTDFFSINAGQYIEVKFSSTDTNISILTTAATSLSPAAPASIMSVTQVQQ